MNVFVKAIIRAAVDKLIAQLDLLISQIRSGDTQGAISNVDAMKSTIVGLRDKFLS